MDRTTWAWSAATATGVVALLLMLAWQLSSLKSIAADSETTNNATDTNTGKTEPAGKDPAKKDDWIVTNTVDADPPNGQQEPDAQAGPRWRGIKIKGASPSDDTTASPPTTSEKPPFDSPPADSKPGSESASPFDNPPTPKTDGDAPPARSPFGLEPENPSAKAPPKPDPFDETPRPEAANPFAKTKPAERPPEKKQPAEDKLLIPLKPAVVQPEPKVVADSLTIELVRVGSTPAASNDGHFLVTSLGSPAERPSPVSLAGGPSSKSSDGWNIVGRKNTSSAIIPTRHGVGRPGQSTAISFHGAASVATRWAVAAPRLSFEVIAPTRAAVGESLPIQLRVTNTGSAAATGVKLQIDLPDSLAYHVGRRLEHTVGRLEPGESRTARLTPKVVIGGSIELPAAAVADDGMRTPAVRRTDVTSASTRGVKAAAPKPRRPRPAANRLRRATVECYDGQRIILIRR